MGTDHDSAPVAARAGWGWAGAAAVGVAQVAVVATGAGPRPGPVAVAALVLGALVAPGLAGAAVAALPLRGRGEWVAAGAWLGLLAVVALPLALAAVPLSPRGSVPLALAVAAVAPVAVLLARRRGSAVVARWWLVALAVAVLATLAGRLGHALRPAAAGPSVLLVTIDGSRVAPVDGVAPDRPTLRRLAADGVTFARAHAQVGATGPSHAGLFAGRAPWELGMLLDGAHAPADHPVVAEVLRDAGYRTGAFTSAWGLDHALGLSRGFDTYDDDFGWVIAGRYTLAGRLVATLRGRDALPRERRASETVDRAIRWIDGRSGPWFAWVHLGDARPPWTPPPPYDDRYYRGLDARDPLGQPIAEQVDVPAWLRPSLDGITDREWVVSQWLGETAFADAQLGRLLTWLEQTGRAGDLVVVVVGATGAPLGDGGVWFEASVVPSATQVPLVARWPGHLPAGAVADGVVELTDLAPSLTAFAGLSAPSAWGGGPIQALVHGGTAPRGTARSVALAPTPAGVVAAVWQRSGAAVWDGTVAVEAAPGAAEDFRLVAPMLAERASALAEDVQRARITRPPLTAADRALLEETGHDLGR